MTWNPDSGQSPNRAFVLASEDLWREYHRRRAALQPEVSDGAHPAYIEVRRDEIRAWVKRAHALGMSGLFIIPV